FCDDGETLMAQVTLCDFKSAFCGNIVGCLGIAGVSTYPEYRRSGAVRKIFEKAFELSNEKSWDVSFLYPFSYNYYRKFGYERILKHKTMTFSFDMLSHLQRNSDFVLYRGDEDQKALLLKLYNEFALKHNCMLYRENANAYSKLPNETLYFTYICGNCGYVTVHPTENSTLEITELIYDNADTLKNIFGFLKMYEGQFKKLHFPFLEFDSPIEYILNADRCCGFGMYDGAMGRVINIKKLLKLNKYPVGNGRFSLCIYDDFIADNNAIYDVEYCEQTCVNINIRQSGNFDVKISLKSFNRFIFGDVPSYGAEYVPELQIISKRNEFLNSFPQKRLNLLDRF
ncbi:MAG: GNAT family N-acetyltransferase, partial [Clostridia bacterium]